MGNTGSAQSDWVPETTPREDGHMPGRTFTQQEMRAAAGTPFAGAMIAAIDPTDPQQTRAILAVAIERMDQLDDMAALDDSEWRRVFPRLTPDLRGIVQTKPNGN